MALVRTALLTATAGPTHGTGTYTTGSFTPPNSSLLVLGGMAIEDGEFAAGGCTQDLSITDSAGLAWTSRIDELGNDGATGDYTTGLRIWTAPVTTGVSMTITLDLGSRSAGIYAISVVAYTGYDTGTPIGVTGKNNAGFGPAGTPTAGSLTLSGSPASNSEVFAAVGVNHSVGGVTHGTGWTEIHDSSSTSWGGLQAQARTGSTSTSVGWDSLNVSGNLFNYAAAAVEVKDSGVAAALPGIVVEFTKVL